MDQLRIGDKVSELVGLLLSERRSDRRVCPVFGSPSDGRRCRMSSRKRCSPADTAKAAGRTTCLILLDNMGVNPFLQVLTRDASGNLPSRTSYVFSHQDAAATVVCPGLHAGVFGRMPQCNRKGLTRDTALLAHDRAPVEATFPSAGAATYTITLVQYRSKAHSAGLFLSQMRAASGCVWLTVAIAEQRSHAFHREHPRPWS